MSDYEYPYDAWQKVKTISDYDADLVISALQKEIRRGNEENAVVLAYEMLSTSLEMEEYLWKRIKAICVEDIGFGDVLSPILINSLDSMRQTFPRGAEGVLYAIHAVRYLCQCPKDRSNDEMLDVIQSGYKDGSIKPVIPEYAYDMHTKIGQEKGRSVRHFYEVAAQISPEFEGRNKSYLEKIIKEFEEE